MLRDAAHRNSGRPFLLLYSNRTREQAAFLDELRALAQRHPRLRLMATLTGPADSGWDGLHGRIDAAMLRQALQGLDAPLCHVTGTPAMSSRGSTMPPANRTRAGLSRNSTGTVSSPARRLPSAAGRPSRRVTL